MGASYIINDFDAISNKVIGLKLVAHTFGAHGYCVVDTNGVEAEGNHVDDNHTFMEVFKEEEEMHVTSVSLVLDRGDVDLRLRHVLLEES